MSPKSPATRPRSLCPDIGSVRVSEMPRLRPLLWPLAVLALVLGLGAAAGAWWYHTTRPDYRLRQGRAALQRGDFESAEHFALLLQADGCKDHAHFLRGEAHFLRAKPQLDAGRP